MKALFAVALLVASSALAFDGGFNGWPYEVCEDLRPDAGQAEQLDGGAWLMPHQRFQLTACRLAACAEAVSPEPQAPTATGYLVVAGVAVTVGLIGGLVGGFLLARK